MTVEGVTARIAAGLAGVALLGMAVHLIDGATHHVPTQPSPNAHVTAPDTSSIETGEAIDTHLGDNPSSTRLVSDAMPQSIQLPSIPSIEPFTANELIIGSTESTNASATSSLSSLGPSLGSGLAMTGAMSGISFSTKAITEIPSMLGSLPGEFLPSAADAIPVDALPLP